MTIKNETPARLLQQRQRNHLIRYFQLACDEVALLDYQRIVPRADVLAELICQFSDDFDNGRLAEGCYIQPVYSENEVKALVRFEEIWGLLELLPDHIESIGDFLSSHYWPPFMAEASRVLNVFRKRGFFSDEVLEDFDQ